MYDSADVSGRRIRYVLAAQGVVVDVVVFSQILGRRYTEWKGLGKALGTEACSEQRQRG